MLASSLFLVFSLVLLVVGGVFGVIGVRIGDVAGVGGGVRVGVVVVAVVIDGVCRVGSGDVVSVIDVDAGAGAGGFIIGVVA